MTRTFTYSDIGEYIHFMRRIVRAAGQRVGDADPEQLGDLMAIRNDLDNAIAFAVAGLRKSGATWEDIGNATHMARQSAFEKWAARVKAIEADDAAVQERIQDARDRTRAAQARRRAAAD